MSAPTNFENIIPQIIPTDVTDVYDVVFNVKMPDNIGSTYKDFYCNNKLRVSLSYKFASSEKDKLKYFSSTTGQGQQTACVLTPPIEMSKAAAEYSITETAGEPEKSSLDLVKASGVYFTTYDKLNEKIKKTFEDTYNKLYNGFNTIAEINKKTGESLKLAQTCKTDITTASTIETPVPLMEEALSRLAKSPIEALAGITESVTKMEKLKSLDDYFSIVFIPPPPPPGSPLPTPNGKDKITNMKNLINVANTAATKANTDVKAYVDAQQKNKEATTKLDAAKKKLDAAKKKLDEKEEEAATASSAASSAAPSAPRARFAAAAAATALKTAETAVESAKEAERKAQEEHTQAESDAKGPAELVKSLEVTTKDSNDASVAAIDAAHEAVNALSEKFLPFDMDKFRGNIDKDTLNQGKYLMNALRENLLPTNAHDSTFKTYKSSYNDESRVSDFLMNSGTVQESVKVFNGVSSVNNMHFDFNLYDYQLNSSQDGVTKKVDKTHDPEQKSLLLLLKKNQYFSIVFKNITIPFDVSEIPPDTVTVSLKIINTKSMGTLAPASATQFNSQDAFHIFYNFFFPIAEELLLMNTITYQITVKDFFFDNNDMQTAYDSSDKYKDKYHAMQKMSRMFLVYYIKFLGDSFTTEYGQMITDITAARTETSLLIPENLTTATKKGQLSTKVSTANNDIVEFSQKFSFQDIENFRKQFSQALSRELRLTGIAKINDDLVLKILTQMSKKRNTILDPVEDISKENILKPNPKTAAADDSKTTIENLTSISKGETGLGVVQGGEYSNEQSGGAIPLVNTSTAESWNYIVPMCMASAGSGLNNMVVTIDKKILREPSAGESPDFTSVNIQVGDTIRFVNKEGNITYAVVCGFKPGKKNKSKVKYFANSDSSGLDRRKEDDNSRDYEMNMTDFRNTNIDIIKSIQSQKLSITPLQFLNVTNLRGIRYLPFTYDDTTYSFADSGERDGVTKSKNFNLKAGLKGKFTFRCDIKAIPLLPNGYKYSWGSKALESIKNFGRKYMPGSTQADIGKDMDIPEYSLSSYMTLEKVMAPLNFDPVISYLKKQKDSAINDPDSMIKDLVKIMQDNGLNLTDSCKDKTGKLQTADLEQRKTEFITTANMIRNRFNAECMLNGVVNPDKTVKFIQGLYKEYVETGILVNEQGIPMQTVPQIIYALSLIPGNVDLNMKLLLLALSQINISTFKTQRATLSSKITTQRTEDKMGEDVLEGGATPDQAKQIIMKSIDTLAAQGFLPPGSADNYRRVLNAASIGFDPAEEMKTLQENVAKAKENAAAYVNAQNAALRVKGATSGLSPTGSQMVVSKGSDGAGAGASDVAKKGMMDKAKGAIGKLSDFFKPKQSGMGMVAVGAPMFSGDSCGNNTNITCNGEDLIISVSLKLSDLISSCVDPDMIGHINRALDAGANQSNTTNNPPLLADTAVEVGGRSEQAGARQTQVSRQLLPPPFVGPLEKLQQQELLQQPLVQQQPSPYSPFAVAKDGMEPRIESVNRFVEKEREKNPLLKARLAEALAPQSLVQPPVPTSTPISPSASDFSASLKPGGSELNSAALDPQVNPIVLLDSVAAADGTKLPADVMSSAEAPAAGLSRTDTKATEKENPDAAQQSEAEAAANLLKQQQKQEKADAAKLLEPQQEQEKADAEQQSEADSDKLLKQQQQKADFMRNTEEEMKRRLEAEEKSNHDAQQLDPALASGSNVTRVESAPPVKDAFQPKAATIKTKTADAAAAPAKMYIENPKFERLYAAKPDESAEDRLNRMKAKREFLAKANRRGGSKKRNNNSKSNKSNKNNKSSKRKTRKVTSSKNKKVKFIK